MKRPHDVCAGVITWCIIDAIQNQMPAGTPNEVILLANTGCTTMLISFPVDRENVLFAKAHFAAWHILSDGRKIMVEITIYFSQGDCMSMSITIVIHPKAYCPPKSFDAEFNYFIFIIVVLMVVELLL